MYGERVGPDMIYTLHPLGAVGWKRMKIFRAFYVAPAVVGILAATMSSGRGGVRLTILRTYV